MNKVRNALFISITILVSATVFFTAGLVAGGFGSYRMTAATVEAQKIEAAKSEYYRGVYDVCVQQTRKTDFCLKTVRKVNAAEWYEKPSSGWEWPLATSDTVAKGN